MHNVKDLGNLSAFAAARRANKLSEKLTYELPPQEGDIMEIEHKIGNSTYRFSGIDENVKASMPPDVQAAVALAPDNLSMFLLKCERPGHVRGWIRKQELNPKLGRWLFLEIDADPNEVMRNPNGEVACMYQNVIGLLAAEAYEYNPDVWHEFARETPWLILNR